MRAWVFALLLAAGCAQPAEPPIALQVVWGLTGTAALPADVVDIEIVTCVNVGQEDEDCDNVTCSVNAITGMTANEVPGCRPRAGTEMYGSEPVLVRTDLPTDTPIQFRLHGRDGAGEIAWVGQTTPLILGDGERRFVTMQMFEIGASTPVVGSSVQRILHTSTLLPDGRILIAGGFSTVTPIGTCPASLMLAAEAVCFDLVATNEALAFDVSSGDVTPIRSPMLAARGGHTATALPDGRVLIAGGAARAILAMSPQGVAGASGHAIRFVPFLADGTTEGAEASLEIFDAYLNPEAQDVDRDGDPGRGGFLGTAATSTPVPMNQPRFMHAAAQVASAPARVILVGGLGGADSASTWEVYDNDRVGGYGVYAASDNRLTLPRPMPGAIGVGARVWIFGGGIVRDNGGLAEIWSSDGVDPNGTVIVAAGTTAFPNPMPAGVMEHPEYALVRPQVASIEGMRALVSGWYGPQCMPGTSAPMFPPIGTPSEFCAPPTMPMTRSFTVTDSTGITSPTQALFRAFGDTAILTCFKPTLTTRYVAFTGGAANTAWTGQPAIDVFAGTVDGTGAATRLGDTYAISSTRLFHTSTGIPGLGVITIGGADFGVNVSQLFLVAPVEVLFVPSPVPDEC